MKQLFVLMITESGIFRSQHSVIFLDSFGIILEENTRASFGPNMPGRVSLLYMVWSFNLSHSSQTFPLSPQNHRIGDIGRGHWRSSNPTSVHKQVP